MNTLNRIPVSKRPGLAIRIYALAKELQIDNKKLVDICTRAGITGKGSALASLTDEEEVAVKAHIAAGKGGKADGGGARGWRGAGAAEHSPRRLHRSGGHSAGSKVPVLPVEARQAAAGAEEGRRSRRLLQAEIAVQHRSSGGDGRH